MINKFLEGQLIGISVSGSAELEKLGFSELHLQDSLVELARYLLATGANLAYGGDIKYEGGFNYAGILFELIENFSKEFKDEKVRASNYLCYPLYKRIPDEIIAKYIKKINFFDIVPTGLDITNDNWQETFDAKTVDALYKWSISLREMRVQMNKDIKARIVMGGKVQGYHGRYPGIVEETLLSLQSEPPNPVYLIGAFGGATLAIIKALEGKNPAELQTAFQIQNPLYRDLIPLYNGKHPTDIIDYTSLMADLNKFGVSGLCALNGLTEDENRILFTSQNISEIIMYILKGLKSKLSKSPIVTV